MNVYLVGPNEIVEDTRQQIKSLENQVSKLLKEKSDVSKRLTQVSHKLKSMERMQKDMESLMEQCIEHSDATAMENSELKQRLDCLENEKDAVLVQARLNRDDFINELKVNCRLQDKLQKMTIGADKFNVKLSTDSDSDTDGDGVL